MTDPCAHPTDSMWRIVTFQGLTMTVDSDTLLALCRSLQRPRSIELLRKEGTHTCPICGKQTYRIGGYCSRRCEKS